MQQLIYQVCYSRYQILLYLWWRGLVPKFPKVPKYYDQDCLKMFVLLSTRIVTIKISRKGVHLVQKSLFYQKKTTNKQSLKLSKGKF